MLSLAGHPFNQDTADIALCSSDDIVFKLHKVILCLASDFFKDMLSLPQPSSVESGSSQDANDFDGLPVVHVSEHSKVLDRIFRLCYPVDDPPLETIEEVRSTLEAAMKYQMAEAVKITKRRLLGLARDDPLRVYAVACCFSLEEEASAAAQEVLKQKAQEGYVEELEEISIGAYHRLLSYCQRRGRVRDQFMFTVHRSGVRGPAPSVTSTPTLNAIALDTTDKALEPRVALHPFDDPEAEITLVTSDGVEYRVHKKILQLSSPVLYATAKGLLASDRTTISVAEPSRIMDILLRLCYPVLEPEVGDLHDISVALAAAEKYNMQRASQVLRNAMASRRDSTSDDPVVLYAIACRFGMRDIAVAAARRTLHTEIMQSSVSELDSIGVSGGCLFRLLEYQRRCKAAIRSIFNGTHGWIDSDMLAQLQQCCSMANFNPLSRMPCWYDEYMSRIGEEGWPRSEMVQDELLLLSVVESAERAQRANYPCVTCFDRRGTFLLISFSRCVADTIDSLERKVTLQWTVPSQAQ
ncbi:hypothetical protein L226DRAFT_489116 [Lentinus tigrinus ALCF2SS1-7]|uniref:BTB domain-containing protein n=1 Tax=Lentinus tigrinus ALCF2SS1-6 TaxID=1328759 RepID=A0A5C2S789_9APHY|nr:hypothetical protein L227DRAFT_576648 [Lentinus tigrinus ALCF2SS1-6]RPD73314.1 hypothetical protein L226DRAFT_489116 [Lentinus tigrinus ALCF2SS1-7]